MRFVVIQRRVHCIDPLKVLGLPSALPLCVSCQYCQRISGGLHPRVKAGSFTYLSALLIYDYYYIIHSREMLRTPTHRIDVLQIVWVSST